MLNEVNVKLTLNRLCCATGILSMLLTGTILQPPDAWANAIKECMVNALETADPSTTISALRLQCENQTSQEKTDVKSENVEEVHLVEDRIQEDKKHVLEPFTLMAHKPSYLLVASYNSNGYNTAPWREELADPDFEDWEDTEAQFQLSVKFPLLVNLFDNTFDIYAAYTNRSFWQIYYEDSAPFRETNHEPEMWVQFKPNWEIFGVKNTWNSFGINHQSNGRGGGLSRSWNRLFAWITFEKGRLAFSFKPWYRLPEDSESDDNPDITDYLGHFEFSTSYKWRDHVFSLMSRNNLESGFTKGAVELSWSFPLGDWPYLKGYVQYFNGYGRSLIDYNQRANVIGVGISLIDWL